MKQVKWNGNQKTKMGSKNRIPGALPNIYAFVTYILHTNSDDGEREIGAGNGGRCSSGVENAVIDEIGVDPHPESFRQA